MSKETPKVAFFDFTGCEGCQLTVIDALQTHPDLLAAVDIVEFREAMSESTDEYDIAFIEGSYTREGDKERLHKIRSRSKIVVALGACAHMGGVNGMRNARSMQEIRQYVYGDMADNYQADRALPIGEVIAVDAFLPGCPIDRNEFVLAVKALLQGRQPILPDFPMCVECKLRENICLLQSGVPCLGAVTRAGCGALCPSLGVGCEGCRGMIPNPNLESLELLSLERGVDKVELYSMLSLFMTHPMTVSEDQADGI